MTVQINSHLPTVAGSIWSERNRARFFSVSVLNHGCRCKVQSWRVGLGGGGNWAILLDLVSQLCECELNLGWPCFFEHFPESMKRFWPVPRIGMWINHSISQIEPNWGSGHFDVRSRPYIPPPVLETIVIFHKDTIFLCGNESLNWGEDVLSDFISKGVALSCISKCWLVLVQVLAFWPFSLNSILFLAVQWTVPCCATKRGGRLNEFLLLSTSTLFQDDLM